MIKYKLPKLNLKILKRKKIKSLRLANKRSAETSKMKLARSKSRLHRPTSKEKLKPRKSQSSTSGLNKACSTLHVCANFLR